MIYAIIISSWVSMDPAFVCLSGTTETSLSQLYIQAPVQKEMRFPALAKAFLFAKREQWRL